MVQPMTVLITMQCKVVCRFVGSSSVAGVVGPGGELRFRERRGVSHQGRFQWRQGLDRSEGRSMRRSRRSRNRRRSSRSRSRRSDWGRGWKWDRRRKLVETSLERPRWVLV